MHSSCHVRNFCRWEFWWDVYMCCSAFTSCDQRNKWPQFVVTLANNAGTNESVVCVLFIYKRTCLCRAYLICDWMDVFMCVYLSALGTGDVYISSSRWKANLPIFFCWFAKFSVGWDICVTFECSGWKWCNVSNKNILFCQYSSFKIDGGG